MTKPRRRAMRAAGRRASPLRVYMLMLAPALMLFTVFILIPVVLTVIGSFFTFGLTSPTGASPGFDNYARAANDPVFWLSLRNNLIIVFGSIVTQIGFGTLLAAILDRGIRRGSTVLPHDHLRADGHLVGRRRPDLADDPRPEYRAAEQDREVRSG